MNINFNSFSFGLSGKLIIYKADRLVCEAGDLSPFSVVKYCAVVGPYLGFPAGSDGKESCNAGDLGLIPGLGRSSGGGHGNSL